MIVIVASVPKRVVFGGIIILPRLKYLALHSYSRIDYPNPAVEIHFCPLCGSTTHWVLTEDYKLRSGVSDRMGVNMRLFVEGDLAGVEVKFPNGKAWDGQGDYGYRKIPIIL